MKKRSRSIHQKHPKSATPEESTLLESSNQGQQSNYESNYPNGALSSSGDDDAEGLSPDTNDPAVGDETYGPAPPRDQIRPPETDIAAKDHPADLDEVPASVATGNDNKEYMRHFSSPEEYRKWLERADQAGSTPEK